MILAASMNVWAKNAKLMVDLPLDSESDLELLSKVARLFRCYIIMQLNCYLSKETFL